MFFHELTYTQGNKDYLWWYYISLYFKVWRTGERINNGSFAWYSGDVGGKIIYTNWNDSTPATYSSFAWLYGTRKRRSHRDGVWIDSFHACPFICERRSKCKQTNNFNLYLTFNLPIMIIKPLQTAWNLTRRRVEYLGVWSGSKLFATQPICLPNFK